MRWATSRTICKVPHLPLEAQDGVQPHVAALAHRDVADVLGKPAALECVVAAKHVLAGRGATAAECCTQLFTFRKHRFKSGHVLLNTRLTQWL